MTEDQNSKPSNLVLSNAESGEESEVTPSPLVSSLKEPVS